MDEESRKKEYKVALDLFIKEVRKLKSNLFTNIDNWALDEDILNGVLLGYSIQDEKSRLFIHNMGEKYGLIPLCPEDLIDLDYSTGNMRPVIITKFGQYPINTNKNSQSFLH